MTFMAVILLFIFIVLFFLYFWGLNPHMITIFYLPEQSLTHPAAMVVIACIIVGLILFAPRGLVGSLMQKFPRLRKFIM